VYKKSANKFKPIDCHYFRGGFFAIITKLQQCLGNRSEQNIDHHFFIAQNEVIEFMGKGKEFSVLHPMISETTS